MWKRIVFIVAGITLVISVLSPLLYPEMYYVGKDMYDSINIPISGTNNKTAMNISNFTVWNASTVGPVCNLYESLIIEPGGYLLIDGITVSFNESQLSTVYINVSENGTLELRNATIVKGSMYPQSRLICHVLGELIGHESVIEGIDYSSEFALADGGGIYILSNGSAHLENVTIIPGTQAASAITLLDNATLYMANCEIINVSYGIVAHAIKYLPTLTNITYSNISSNHIKFYGCYNTSSMTHIMYSNMVIAVVDILAINGTGIFIEDSTIVLANPELLPDTKIMFNNCEVNLVNTTFKPIIPPMVPPMAKGQNPITGGTSIEITGSSSVYMDRCKVQGIVSSDNDTGNDGIHIKDSVNINIKNCTISNGTTGISIENVGNGTIADVVFYNFSAGAVRFSGRITGQITLENCNYSQTSYGAVMQDVNITGHLVFQAVQNLMIYDNLGIIGNGRLELNDTKVILSSNHTNLSEIVVKNSTFIMRNVSTSVEHQNISGQIVSKASTLIVEDSSIDGLGLSSKQSAAIYAEDSYVEFNSVQISNTTMALYFVTHKPLKSHLTMNNFFVEHAGYGVTISGIVCVIDGNISTSDVDHDIVFVNITIPEGYTELPNMGDHIFLRDMVNVSKGADVDIINTTILLSNNTVWDIQGNVSIYSTVINGEGTIVVEDEGALYSEGSEISGVDVVAIEDNALAYICNGSVLNVATLSMANNSTMEISNVIEFKVISNLEMFGNSVLIAKNTSIDLLPIKIYDNAFAEEWNAIEIGIMDSAGKTITDAEIIAYIDGERMAIGHHFLLENSTCYLMLPYVSFNSSGRHYYHVTLSVYAQGFDPIENYTLNTSSPTSVILIMNRTPLEYTPPKIISINVIQPSLPGGMGMVEIEIYDADIADGDSIYIEVSCPAICDILVVGKYPHFIVYFTGPYTPGNYSLYITIRDDHNLTNVTEVLIHVPSDPTMDFIGQILEYPYDIVVEDGLEYGVGTVLEIYDTQYLIYKNTVSPTSFKINHTTDNNYISVHEGNISVSKGYIYDLGFGIDIWVVDSIPIYDPAFYTTSNTAIAQGHVYAIAWLDGTYTKIMPLVHMRILGHETGNYTHVIGELATFVWCHIPNGSNVFIFRESISNLTYVLNTTDKYGNSVYVMAKIEGNATLRVVPIELMPYMTAESVLPDTFLPDTYYTILGVVDVYIEGQGKYLFLNITIKLNPEELPGTLSIDTIAIYWWDYINSTWIRASNTGFDKAKFIAWANVTHNTIFAAIGKILKGKDTDGGGGGRTEEGKEAPETSIWGIAVVLVLIVVPLILIYFGVIKRKAYESKDTGDDSIEKEVVEELKEATAADKGDIGDSVVEYEDNGGIDEDMGEDVSMENRAEEKKVLEGEEEGAYNACEDTGVFGDELPMNETMPNIMEPTDEIIEEETTDNNGLKHTLYPEDKNINDLEDMWGEDDDWEKEGFAEDK